jgi:hypothetical protein
MDLSAIGRTQRTHRELIAWFSSPRVAIHTAFRLAETVPTGRVRVRQTEDHGAEGPVVALEAEIPWLWSTMVTRQLNSLGVAVMWDPDAGRHDAGRHDAGPHDAGRPAA